MDYFKILKIDHYNYNAIIFAETYETPFLYLDEISKVLKDNNIKNCKIIFDMLLSNGNTTERYAEAEFDDDEFDKTTFKYINVDKKNVLRKISLNFYKQNKNILQDSILNSLQIKMINKGIAI